MKVIVTGSCGYKGSVIVPRLRAAGHEVVGIDTGWFGGMPEIKADFRTLKWLPKADAIIHLANIANDPCGELDAKLTWEVNGLGTDIIADLAVKAKIPQFIFASSASVYGIKDNKPVTELDDLAPVSDYNKTKRIAERVLLSYQHKMAVQIVRPATVCGYSPRMRLDVIVNMLTMQAITKGEITAHCGEHGAGLMRPHTHIDDAASLYLYMLERPYLTGVYNAGFENLSVMDLAEKIVKHFPAKINVTTVADKRSYCVDSSKLLNTGFKPAHSVEDAIKCIGAQYQAGNLKDEDVCYNLKWMQMHGWVAG